MIDTFSVGMHLLPGTVEAYEATVSPGLAEEICIPILEDRSGLVCDRGFWVGYSPERINPRGTGHTLEILMMVVDALRELEAYRWKALVHEVRADYEETRCQYGLELVPCESLRDLGAVIPAGAHSRYLAMDATAVASVFKPGAIGLVFDIKTAWDMAALSHVGLKTWHL